MNEDSTEKPRGSSGLEMRTTLGLLPLIALSATMAVPAFAQQTTLGGLPVQLDEVVVEGESNGSDTANANDDDTNLGRLPGKVKDVPQVVNVIDQRTMQQQNTQTLEQVLRNVPGVTMAVGENGFQQGDQFKIRGFEAKGDIYSDGLRDFGLYVRDSFAFESVQVFKGPSSESFGMGTTGGAINTTTKKAHLKDELYVEGQAGTSPMGRAMVDWNKQINDTTAVRIVGMGHLENLAGKDNVDSNRAGVLAALSTGIGTDLTWDLSYMYQHGDRTPDYGVPFITKDGKAASAATKTNVALPITEFGVPRDVFYGRKQDHDVFNAHVVTSQVKWEANDTWTLHNDTRFGYYDRDFVTSNPACNATCAGKIIAGDPTATLSGLGSPAYTQESWGVQNLTTAVGKFETGALRHELVVGLDTFYQKNERDAYTIAGKTFPNVWNPKPLYNDAYTVADNRAGHRKSKGRTIALFASDRVWLTEQFSILAGGRWENYKSESVTPNHGTPANRIPLEQSTSLFSPKASVIWEPTANQSYYASWARSFTPPGQFVTNAGSPIASKNEIPEEVSESYEVGGKINFFDGRLGINAAAFQIDKNNATYEFAGPVAADGTGPQIGDPLSTGDQIRVRGFELGISGQPTDSWTIGLGYSYLDSEVKKAFLNTGLLNTAVIGNVATSTPEHAVSLWTSYLAVEPFGWEGNLNFGGGVTYSDKFYTNTANNAIVPSSISVDAFASYDYKNLKFAVNAYNLTDELNYSAGNGGRATVAPGRSFLFTVGAKF